MLLHPFKISQQAQKLIQKYEYKKYKIPRSNINFSSGKLYLGYGFDLLSGNKAIEVKEISIKGRRRFTLNQTQFKNAQLGYVKYQGKKYKFWVYVVTKGNDSKLKLYPSSSLAL